MSTDINEHLLDFLQGSVSSFHAVEQVRSLLMKRGYEEISEADAWKLEPGKGYLTVRNGSSIIAFRMPESGIAGFMIGASHSDSPTFKIKENPEIAANGYVRLNVEKYGGMLCAPWLDRPLSVAGRIVVHEGSRFFTKLVNVDRDLLVIPNLAIHMNREVNDGKAYNAQVDMLPILGGEEAKGTFLPIIAEAAGIAPEEIAGYDLYLYARGRGTIWGAKQEYLSAGRLDDLQCGFADLQGFLQAGPSASMPMLAIFDNEEVGSRTRQGADSTFLSDVLQRIAAAAGMGEDRLRAALASSFMVSADNAHALHPAFADKADPINRPKMNQGIVLKFNAAQKYTTDAISAAVFRDLCAQEQVPCQVFTNRSDMAGGSTLGNLANAHVSMCTVDIGLAQLAMHSCYETAGTRDTEYLARVMKRFFSASISAAENGSFSLR